MKHADRPCLQVLSKRLTALPGRSRWRYLGIMLLWWPLVDSWFWQQLFFAPNIRKPPCLFSLVLKRSRSKRIGGVDQRWFPFSAWKTSQGCWVPECSQNSSQTWRCKRSHRCSACATRLLILTLLAACYRALQTFWKLLLRKWKPSSEI